MYMEQLFLMFLDHTQRRTTVGRTALDEWSARRRDLCLTTHNTHNRQTSMPPVGFEPTISAGERPQTARPLGPAITKDWRSKRLMCFIRQATFHHGDYIWGTTENRREIESVAEDWIQIWTGLTARFLELGGETSWPSLWCFRRAIRVSN